MGHLRLGRQGAVPVTLLPGRAQGQDGLDHLQRFFGKEARALEITKPRIDEYGEQRLAAGASRATVNYEVAALRRAFRLAVENGQLATAPVFKLPKVHNERQGFFEEDDLAALLVELPSYLGTPIRFACMTGWRVQSEVLPLTWEAVDWEGQIIRLAQSATKGGEPRLFPFGQAPELKALLEERWAVRDGLFVFHRDGRRIRRASALASRAASRTTSGGRRPATSAAPASRSERSWNSAAGGRGRRSSGTTSSTRRTAPWPWRGGSPSRTANLRQT